MNSNQIRLVRQTFGAIESDKEAVGTLFYHRLFEIDPSLQALFKGDMKAQANMLLTSIGMAVHGLHDPDTLLPQIQSLGQRHASYGAAPADFDTFSAALMWTLQQSLADAFTPEVHQAWIGAFEFIRMAMKKAVA